MEDSSLFHILMPHSGSLLNKHTASPFVNTGQPLILRRSFHVIDHEDFDWTL